VLASLCFFVQFSTSIDVSWVLDERTYFVCFAVDLVDFVDALGIHHGSWRSLALAGSLCVVDEALNLADVLEAVFTNEQSLTVLVLIRVGRIVPCRDIVSCIENPFHVPDLWHIFVVVVVSMWANRFNEAPVLTQLARPL
jgi:hypothetical protein